MSRPRPPSSCGFFSRRTLYRSPEGFCPLGPSISVRLCFRRLVGRHNSLAKGQRWLFSPAPGAGIDSSFRPPNWQAISRQLLASCRFNSLVSARLAASARLSASTASFRYSSAFCERDVSINSTYLLELARNAAERSTQLGADRGNDRDDRGSNTSGDETVFDRSRPSFTLEERDNLGHPTTLQGFRMTQY